MSSDYCPFFLFETSWLGCLFFCFCVWSHSSATCYKTLCDTLNYPSFWGMAKKAIIHLKNPILQNKHRQYTKEDSDHEIKWFWAVIKPKALHSVALKKGVAVAGMSSERALLIMYDGYINAECYYQPSEKREKNIDALCLCHTWRR